MKKICLLIMVIPIISVPMATTISSYAIWQRYSILVLAMIWE